MSAQFYIQFHQLMYDGKSLKTAGVGIDTPGSVISICKPSSTRRVEWIRCRSRGYGINQNLIHVAHDNTSNIHKLLMKSLSNLLQWFVEVSV